jgi:dGTPase
MILKGIAAHYVMQADDRVRAIHRSCSPSWSTPHQGRSDHLDAPFADDWADADDDLRRRRVVDQVAS